MLKYGCFGVLGLCLILIISLPFVLRQAFGPLNERVEIEQDIGGVLICNSEYNADLGSWFYDIDYQYRNKNGKSTNIGSGEFYGQEWNKDEQIQKMGEWMVLKTGGEHGADKLLIGNMNYGQWKIFKISPDEIEKDSLWKSKNIFTKKNWLPRESFVREIHENEIKVEYLYRTGESVDDRETQLIIYEFDEISGFPVMKSIELIESSPEVRK